MKKYIISAILSLALVMSIFTLVSAEDATYFIPKAKNAPTLDAVIGEDEWYGAASVKLSDFKNAMAASGGPTRDLGAATEIKIMWHGDKLYFAVLVEDVTLSAANYCGGRASWAVHWGDSVEVYTGADSCYTVYPYDEWNPGAINTALIFNNTDFTKLADKFNNVNADTIAAAVSMNGDNTVMYNYVMEWSMPISAFGASAEAGASFGLAFGLTNADMDSHVSNNPKLSFWNDFRGAEGAWANTAKLTDAVAGEKPVVTTADNNESTSATGTNAPAGTNADSGSGSNPSTGVTYGVTVIAACVAASVIVKKKSKKA